MRLNSKHGILVLRSWSLLHRVRDVLMRCEDERFGKYGLTSEQYGVLITIKYIGKSARPTDIARRLARSPNSISMIVDRMVKAGLVRRTRDRRDRRVVFVTITNKGEKALHPATAEGLDFIERVTSALSNEDLSTLVKLLELVTHGALGCLKQEVAIEEIGKDDITTQPDLMKRLREYAFPSNPEAKPHGEEKGKPDNQLS
jgi:DNA-binding MarR family transcriptional regulator